VTRCVRRGMPSLGAGVDRRFRLRDNVARSPAPNTTTTETRLTRA